MGEMMLLQALGTGLGVAGTLAEAAQQQDQLLYQSKVQEQQADEAEASGQRAAANQYKQGRMLQSRQRAVGAFTSGDTTDQSIISMMGQANQETNLAARTEMYKAEQQKRGYLDAADISRKDARNAMTNGILGAAAQGVKGAAGMYDKHNKDGGTGLRTIGLPFIPR